NERAHSLSILSTHVSVLCLSLMLLGGCGYQFRVEGAGPTIGGAAAASSSTSPTQRLVVRTLENKSFEPNLETRYTNYLRHEFSSGSGAQIVPESEAADLVLSGQILSVILPTLSYTQTTTLESRVEVLVIVKVEETRTKRVVWAQTAKGAAEFFVTSDLQFNRVLQNRALEQAGRFIAEDLASRFLLQLESGQLVKSSVRQAPDNADTPIK
ncbi:MAG TPA: LPS assembly lipoprotein LptE, partial [Nitrospiraceae bacterium]|nr:LPS assembly lipoprotein LptE [Nitrospiraceae bacterium]